MEEKRVRRENRGDRIREEVAETIEGGEEKREKEKIKRKERGTRDE